MARTVSFLSKNNEWSFLNEEEKVIPLNGYTHDWTITEGSAQSGIVSDNKHIYSHYVYKVTPTNNSSIKIKLANNSVPPNITESSALANLNTNQRIKFITDAPLSGYTYNDGVITSSSNEFLTIAGDTLTHGASIAITGTERNDATYTATGHNFDIGDFVTITGVAPDVYAVVNKEVIATSASTFTVGDMPSDIGTATPSIKVSSEQQAYAIGDTGPAGGKIFITPSTSGNTTGLYFEAAPVATEVSRTWATGANQSAVATGADGTLIGTGEANTLDIVAQSGNVTATSAAVYCDSLSYGGFIDWFLPSKNELNQMYDNKTTIGGFSSVAYWSSSESAASTAWSQNFSTGTQTSVSKSTASYVRPVRSFSEPNIPSPNYSYVTSASISSTQLTYTSVDHGLIVGSIVTVVGATNNFYNVIKKTVTAKTDNTFTIVFTGADPGVPLSPSISATVTGGPGAVTIVSAVAPGTGATNYITSAAHGFTTGDTVTVTGITPSSYNNRATITVVNSTQFYFSSFDGSAGGPFSTGGTYSSGGTATGTPTTITDVGQNNVTYITPGHRFSVGQLVSISETFPNEYNVVKAPIIRVTNTKFTVAGISSSVSPMTVPGVAQASGDKGARVLVKSEINSNAEYNGIYTVLDVGGPSNNWVLERTESYPLAFHCMTLSETRNIESQVKIYESGASLETIANILPFSYTSNAGRYGAVRSNIFDSFSALSSYNIDIEITISNHMAEPFYITLPFLYNYYGWLSNTYVQNAKSQYLPHFYWEIDSQQEPDYPFYKLLDVLTYKADEVMQSYTDFFAYELSELPVSADGTENFANSTLTGPSHVSLENRNWLGQFTGRELFLKLPPEVADGSVDVEEFIEWQLVNRYLGYRAGSTQSLISAVQLCLSGDKTVLVTPNAENETFKIKIYTKVGETPDEYAIGDTGPAGGKVFITPSTSGNTTGLYFEAAPVATEVSRSWATGANQSAVVTGADGTIIGTGEANTLDIVAQSGNVTATSAAVYCDSLSYGGFIDWFLPSKNELNQMYVNKTTIGDFSSVAYWSSSESAASTAWSQNFSTGTQTSVSKSTASYVRPVRSFGSTTVLALAELQRPMGYIYLHEEIITISFVLNNYAAGILDLATLGDGPLS